jgi:hypothetical protein
MYARRQLFSNDRSLVLRSLVFVESDLGASISEIEDRDDRDFNSPTRGQQYLQAANTLIVYEIDFRDRLQTNVRIDPNEAGKYGFLWLDCVVIDCELPILVWAERR